MRRSFQLCSYVLLAWAASGCDEVAAAPPPEPPPARVEAVQLTAADLPVSFEFVGRTASSQRVEILARVLGYLDEIVYEEGEFVEEGDVLFRIDPKPFEAQLRAARAEMAQQEARSENAEALLARVRPLAETGAVAQKELDDAVGMMREAKAAVEAASARVFEAELNLGYTTITSPVTGLAGAAAQRQGAYLSQMAGSLTYVARIDPIWVEFSVSESQMLRGGDATRQGRIVHPEDGAFDVQVVLSDGTTHPETGRLSFADASISEDTGTFLVRADIPNPDHTLRPGQFARIVLKGAYRPDAITAPQRAVKQGPKGSFVWVVNDQGLAEQRPVITGPWVEDAWVIEQGLRDGDRLIVDGSAGLRPGAPVSIVSISRPALERPEAGE